MPERLECHSEDLLKCIVYQPQPCMIMCQEKLKLVAHPGPKHQEEEELASFILQIARIGYPRTKAQILALVQQIIENKGIKAIVSNGWWERFLQRHSQLPLRSAVPLSMKHAIATDLKCFNSCLIY